LVIAYFLPAAAYRSFGAAIIRRLALAGQFEFVPCHKFLL
jgi:hypothetical protein